MNYTKPTIQDFLAGVSPFNQLSSATLARLSRQFHPLRYRMGQAILVKETMPAFVAILYEGQARLLGYAPGAKVPETLQLLQPGAVLGWAGLIRGVPCETAITSTEAICLTLSAADFLALLELEPLLAEAFHNCCALIEVFDLLGAELERQANQHGKLKELALKAWSEAVVLNLPPGRTSLRQLDPDLVWLVSGGASTNFSVSSRVSAESQTFIEVEGPLKTRLVGLLKPTQLLADETTIPSLLAGTPKDIPALPTGTSTEDVSYAPDRPPDLETNSAEKQSVKYPYVHARGPTEAALACFQMLSQHLGIPFRRHILRRALANQFDRTGSISLQLCGAVAELMGLNSQLLNVPAVAVSRLQTPAMLRWQDSFALLYKTGEKELVLAVPESGVRRLKPANFIESWGEFGQVLLLQPTQDTPKQRFGLSWFLPSLYRYRRVLLEVFIASFFVQLFGLANPLITQVIIDKVLVQNSIDTLHILGIFLVGVAIFEAVVTSLRTNLFVDTTNRIDLTLGSQVIDHLLRLPLRYFERRPVGELATRINELENIRSFLTGTALTVMLDAVFSVIYIVVMLFYSWLLTLVALVTVPLFALLTFVATPVIQQQLRTKAERNAQTQSYLVEVVSGIQTVKAQ
ncbi:MAG: cyclic nucleotide-binding domain-containing protein, partial [Chroococcidiopsidaceae cyanobacterium CP_BM_ER_R8_30]|nr:cyclic nucleotide-binding domain-containing protein [Chroococcidiopsidaceae cyanobacterium CP_BM_ER_R8_30]